LEVRTLSVQDILLFASQKRRENLLVVRVLERERELDSGCDKSMVHVGALHVCQTSANTDKLIGLHWTCFGILVFLLFVLHD
jgi:hypothetical protein